MSQAAIIAISLVLIGAILRAARKVWTKIFQATDHPQQWKKRPSALTAVQMYVASGSFFIWAALTGGANLETDTKTYVFWIAGAGFLAIFNMAARTQLQGLKGISLATPIEAMVPLGALVLSPVFGKDLPLNTTGIVGVGFMVLGFYSLDLKKAQLVARREGRANFNLFTPFLLLRENPALLAVVLVVALGSICVNLDARISRMASIPWSFAWIFLVSAIGNTLRGYRKGEFTGLRLGHLLAAASPGVLFGTGNGITNYGFHFASVGAIAALKRLDGIFALIGSFWINKEREDFWNRFISLCLILTGICLLAIAI